MSLSGKRFETTAGISQVVRDVEQRVGSLPGVVAVTSSWSLPLELALTGVALGVAASLCLTRVMASLIYGVTTSDPVTISAVCLLLSLVALAATYVPSRRATRIDPVEALRHE